MRAAAEARPQQRSQARTGTRRVFTVYIIFLPSISPQDLCCHTLLVFTILLLLSPDKHHLSSTTAPLFWPSLNSPCEAEQCPVTRGCSVLTVQPQMRWLVARLHNMLWMGHSVLKYHLLSLLSLNIVKTSRYKTILPNINNKCHICLSKSIKRNFYLLFIFICPKVMTRYI